MIADRCSPLEFRDTRAVGTDQEAGEPSQKHGSDQHPYAVAAGQERRGRRWIRGLRSGAGLHEATLTPRETSRLSALVVVVVRPSDVDEIGGAEVSAPFCEVNLCFDHVIAP